MKCTFQFLHDSFSFCLSVSSILYLFLIALCSTILVLSFEVCTYFVLSGIFLKYFYCIISPCFKGTYLHGSNCLNCSSFLFSCLAKSQAQFLLKSPTPFLTSSHCSKYATVVLSKMTHVRKSSLMGKSSLCSS